MPKCDNCAKGPLYGNNRPWSNKATRRHWHPNIQKIKVIEDGRSTRIDERDAFARAHRSIRERIRRLGIGEAMQWPVIEG